MALPMSSRRPLALAVCLTLCIGANAAEAPGPKRDVNAALAKGKTVRLSTDEGTWLDLDLSPDGQ